MVDAVLGQLFHHLRAVSFTPVVPVADDYAKLRLFQRHVIDGAVADVVTIYINGIVLVGRRCPNGRGKFMNLLVGHPRPYPGVILNRRVS